jgi:tetratricopeptide (TPR) repeat protein
VSAPALLVALALSGAASASAVPAPPPIVGQAAAGRTFEELLGTLSRAEASGDAASVNRALAEIRRARIERNVESHDTLGLGFVRRGVEQLDAHQRDAAEESFRNAVALAPGLPDGHYGLATALLRKGVLGLVPSVNATVAGTTAFLATARGELSARHLLTIAGLLFALVLAWTVAFALLLRRGPLLKHDIDEWLGPGRSGSAALALALALLLLPVITFQGWGWLPLWWLALLLAYLDLGERLLAGSILLGAVVVGPAISTLDFSQRTVENPLYWAALSAVEGAPSAADLQCLEQAARADPQDRDLQYLLGAARKRSGRYEEAAELYRRLLAADANDAYARNNLANIEFARGAYDAALLRYRAGTESGGSPEVVATSYYNLSLAHLQKFDYQAYNEAKSNADRVARSLVSQYDRWKYDSGDYATVDLDLTREQLWTKLGGRSSGVAERNVVAGGTSGPPAGLALSAFANRFSASLGVFVLAALALGRWRGPKAFTARCAKCGTAFCRHCQLGQASGGLCSQCYHLFVVRDGVSGPARNRKMAEVQHAEARRDRVFRALSVVAPGAGHIYAGHTLVGSALLGGWYALAALLAASRLAPLTDVAARLLPPWPLLAAGVLLAALWIFANRLQPEFDVVLPTRRPGPRRARAPLGA